MYVGLYGKGSILCDKCYHNISPELEAGRYVANNFCEANQPGFPNRIKCAYYNEDGMRHLDVQETCRGRDTKTETE